MEDLIFVSMENWDDIWRRNQFLCAGYADRFQEAKILFVGPARDISNQLRHGRIRSLQESATSTVADYPNITVTRPLKLFPNTLPICRKFNEAMTRRHVARAARELSLRKPILWLNPHYALHMAGQMSERAVIYDITDDWISLTQSPGMARLTADQDSKLCHLADAVIVCSQQLYELKRPMARDVHLIPNGVDTNHYSGVLDRSGPVPSCSERWARPVLGYTGTIHPDRVDVGLIEAVAKQMPEASVVLVGPNYLPSSTMDQLRAIPNLFFVGAVPYHDIPSYMRTFDVCITPHLVTPFTESLNPIKLWEYLASGKPIVSTDVAGFRDYPRLVHIARGPAEFADAVRMAVGEDPSTAQARKREASQHTWRSRLDDVLAVIEGVAPSQA